MQTYDSIFTSPFFLPFLVYCLVCLLLLLFLCLVFDFWFFLVIFVSCFFCFVSFLTFFVFCFLFFVVVAFVWLLFCCCFCCCWGMFLFFFFFFGGGGGGARFLFILVFPPSTHQTWCLRLVVLFLPMWWGATARKLGWCRYRGHWRSGPRHLSPWSRVCAQEWHRKDSHSHIHSHPPMLTPNLTKSETINSPNMTPAISCPLPVQSWR